VGWNVIGFDLDFIARKCEQLNIPLDLGRGGDASAVLQVGSGANPVRIARVPGRAVLDGIEMLRAAFWSFESFSLENVGQELLGRGKTIKSVNKVEEINHLYQTNKPELCLDCIAKVTWQQHQIPVVVAAPVVTCLILNPVCIAM